MQLRIRIGTFVAAVCIVGAIGAAPASAASPGIPSTASIAALCKNIKDPKLQSACTSAAGKLNTSKPVDIKGLIDKYGGLIGGGSVGGLNIASLQNLLKGLGGSGGSSVGGFDISKILSGLGGSGGFDISKLLAGLKK